ncbi:MAG: SDR family NAD(P)-dependent oxidoreductase [Elusimicrobia bacterium]|nr:SDR family NAD(P)-dependent oxidoreductase [Elusimicrobiota bacterium]
MFPKADGLGSYWANIKGRVDGVTEVPATHWSPEDYYDPDQKSPDRTYGRRGGFLEPVDFDPTEFGISPNNIPATDPAQLLGLLVAQQALRDAGYGPERPFDRKRVSVILGVTGTLETVIPLGARLGHPVWRKALREAGIEGERAEAVIKRISDSYVEWQENSFPGLLGNVVAGRIANRLDLGGTNCVVDAACASSLAAANMAALELTLGRSDMIVTGGVDAFNDIFMYMCFSKTPALSATGDCRPFDSAGDGTILGEGLGMIVLKRLADAERDGDRVYAVLKAIGSSSDGKGKAIYAPSPEGQTQALKNAYRLAGVTPDTIELLEAHGTGTKVGDAAELHALTEVYREARPDGTWCALGSVKSNLGHTKAAAGAAGIIKAALALHHKILPPTIKIRQPLPELASGQTPFYANTEMRPWLPPAGHPRRAGVSSFGFGGSNFHAVLEEHRPSKVEADWDGGVELVALSAPSLEALRAEAAAWAVEQPWDGLRVKAVQSRRAFDRGQPFRLVVVVEKGKSPAKAFGSWNVRDGAFYGEGPLLGKVAFVFPGQGSQYVGMGRDLACLFPEMHDTLVEADAAFGGQGPGGRLSDLLCPPATFTEAGKAGAEAALRATTAAQPAIGAVSLGAMRVLAHFGLKPEAAAGHSYGELTALCAAGRFDPAALHALSKLRGQLMAAGGGDKGTMLAAKAPIADVERLLAEEGLDLVLANRNAPAQSVLSGRTDLIAKAAEALARRAIPAVPLPVAAAFHSPLVADAKVPFRAALGKAAFAPAGFPVYSNTTARPYPAAPDAARELLAGQLAAPVEFMAMVERMHADGCRVFVEVGPGNRLTGLVASILGGKPHAALALEASGGRADGVADLARALAHLAALGAAVDLQPWQGGEAGVRHIVTRKKSLVAVKVCGATPVNPKGRQPAKMPPPAPSAGAPRPADAPALPRKAEAPVAPQSPQGGRSPFLEGAAQEGLAALERLQEQTAQLHLRFLEGQESIQRTLLTLVTRPQITCPPRGGADAASLVPPHKEFPDETAAIPPQLAPRTRPSYAGGASDLVAAILLAVVSEKTGYPAETLDLDMGLEADLGIDSIKRVEILSAMRERLPDAPAVGPEHIGALRTLRQIIDFLITCPPRGGASSGGADAASLVPPLPAPRTRPSYAGGASDLVAAILLAVVSEKTGYPAETLNLDMGLEADLGIDSIKRVEILSAMRERLPDAPAVGPEHIGALRTLRQIIDFLITCPPRGGASSGGADAASLVPPLLAPRTRPSYAGGASGLECVTPSLVPVEDGRKRVPVAAGGEVWVTEDGSGLAKAVAAKLAAAGLRPTLLSRKDWGRPAPAGLAGLAVLAPASQLNDDGLWPEDSERWLKDAFQLCRAAAAPLRKTGGSAQGGAGGAFLATVSRLDGGFGLAGLDERADPLFGGLAGLAKTARLEWPEVHCKAIDASRGWKDIEALAQAVVDEALTAGPAEVGITPSERRTIDLLEARPAASPGRALAGPGEVVVVTGGARGVTAACAQALAEASRPTLLLLGRTPEPQPEPDWLRDLADEAAIKRAILAQAKGKPPSPRVIGERYRLYMANREVLAAVARLESVGAKALYRSVDIRDAAALQRVLDEARRLGPIRAVVHGAGVLADKHIADKTPEQFDAVFDTKVAGLRSLLKATAGDDLRAVVLFSSVSGRHGRVGQADYAVANEALNKVAQSLARRRPGCRVSSINWGPWNGGMVTPALLKVFEREGVAVLGLEAGARHLVSDMAAGPGSPVETVVTAPAAVATPQRGLATAFARELDLAGHRFLASHVINGRPVLPLAVTLEWLAHGALHGNPGLAFHGVDDLRVFKGVILKGSVPMRLRVAAGKARREGSEFRVPVELLSDDPASLHARADIILSPRLPAAPSPQAPVSLHPYPRSVDAAYEDILFHGPALRAVAAVEGCSPEGIAVRAHAAPAPGAWLRESPRSAWVADPMAIDAAFQAAILWSFEQSGACCLPWRIGAYRQYRAEFPKEGLRVVLRVTKCSEHAAVADVDFLDAAGALVARIASSEHTIDPSLTDAFRKNSVEDKVAA